MGSLENFQFKLRSTIVFPNEYFAIMLPEKIKNNLFHVFYVKLRNISTLSADLLLDEFTEQISELRCDVMKPAT